MKTILITGCTGSIGSVLYRELKKIPDTVVVGTSRKIDETCQLFKCDLLKKEEIGELFKLYDFDYIFHFAANPIVDISKTGIEDIYDSNVKATLNLLDSIPKGKCPVFVFASSATVYAPESLLTGANENMVPRPNSIYGASKVASEALIGVYGNMGRIKPLILRYCAVVGPNSTHGVLPDLCRKYKNDEVVKILGNKPGSQKPFIYVEDAISHTFSLAFSGKTGIYNIANTDTVSVQEIVDIIKEKLKYDKQEEWQGDWIGDNLVVKIDIMKMLLDLKFNYHHIDYISTSRGAVEKVIGKILNDNNKGSCKV